MMECAVRNTHEAVRVRTFKSRLRAMAAGECVMLKPIVDLTGEGEGEGGNKENQAKAATLVARDVGYLLVHADSNLPEEALTLEEADARLAIEFALPAASKAELSVVEATAIRVREARNAAKAREEAKRAAVEAATLEWQNDQAALAAELGISYEDWQRITKLLMCPPPKLVGGHLVTNSVAIGRAIVVDHAIQEAIREDLAASVEAEKQRRDRRKARQGAGSVQGRQVLSRQNSEGMLLLACTCSRLRLTKPQPTPRKSASTSKSSAPTGQLSSRRK